MDYDFSGYVTRNDLRCSDGRVIRRNAFKDCDGVKVPLVWAHCHDDPTNVLGHALLENRDDGVYGYGKFNNTDRAVSAKEAVMHGDICAMSIFANKLKQNGSDVVHGVIREVSLVMAGANPGAYIDNLNIAHSDGSYTTSEDEAVIYHGEEGLVFKNEEEEMSNTNSFDVSSLSHDQLSELAKMLNGFGGNELSHEDDKTIEDVFNELTEEQKNVVYFLIGKAIEDNEAEHGDFEGEDFMKHNIFDDSYDYENVLSHEEIDGMFQAAVEMSPSSLKKFLSEESLQHGVENLDILFPEAQMVRPTPDMITRQMDWVSNLWGGLHKSPFSRIKSSSADLTLDAAMAKGYVKGN